MRRYGPPVARRVGIVVWWVGIVGGVAAMGAYALRPYRAGPRQPVPFSHYRHAGIRGIGCYFCHPGADRSPVAGLPSMQKCLLCHRVIAPQFGPISKVHASYSDSQPLQWERVYRLPDHVHFNHQAHVVQDIDCGECHGDVKSMNRVILNQRLTMGFCVDCHRREEYQASVDCWVCHR